MRKGILYTGIGATVITALLLFYFNSTKPVREANLFQKLSGLDKQVLLQKPKEEQREIMKFIKDNKESLENRFLEPEIGSDPNQGAYAYLNKESKAVYFCWDGLYAKPIEAIAKEGVSGFLDFVDPYILGKVRGKSLQEALNYLNGQPPVKVGGKYIGLAKVEPPDLDGLRRVGAWNLYNQTGTKAILTHMSTDNKTR